MSGDVCIQPKPYSSMILQLENSVSKIAGTESVSEYQSLNTKSIYILNYSLYITLNIVVHTIFINVFYRENDQIG